ncbi:hypothetical protein ZHAS_00004019 [Anopheles sinensis]|uniref:Uncharacterized protein n=1 Tax=Anopheles sinensis TaxID=74873 RepID=A0A084VFV5_ANOSI|nr:hypothetical protein ZHAS_00004019 [Anopheles sinensis]
MQPVLRNQYRENRNRKPETAEERRVGASTRREEKSGPGFRPSGSSSACSRTLRGKMAPARFIEHRSLLPFGPGKTLTETRKENSVPIRRES